MERRGAPAASGNYAGIFARNRICKFERYPRYDFARRYLNFPFAAIQSSKLYVNRIKQAVGLLQKIQRICPICPARERQDSADFESRNSQPKFDVRPIRKARVSSNFERGNRSGGLQLEAHLAAFVLTEEKIPADFNRRIFPQHRSYDRIPSLCGNRHAEISDRP